MLDVRFAEESRAWTPKITDFAKEVLSSMQELNKNAKFEAVHAGLECGVLSISKRAMLTRYFLIIQRSIKLSKFI